MSLEPDGDLTHGLESLKVAPVQRRIISGSGNWRQALASQQGSSAFIVRFSEQGTRLQLELEEDLNVMSRLLERSIQRLIKEAPEVRMGVPILLNSSTSGSVQGLYLEGFGTLFTLTVNFPLVAPSKSEEVRKEDAEKGDDWEAARRDLFRTQSPAASKLHDSYGFAVSGASFPIGFEKAEYDPVRVEKLTQELVEALKNASNIRHLRPEEFAAVIVLGSSSGASLHGKILSMDKDHLTGTTILNMLDENKNSYVVSIPRTGMRTRSALSIRVKKSDADSLAAGALKHEDFKKAANIQAYHTLGGPIGISTDDDTVNPFRNAIPGAPAQPGGPAQP